MVLRIEKRESPEETLIAVHGKVTLYSSPELRAQLLEAAAGASSGVAVDLSQVGYIDSSGVATLVEGLMKAREHETAFTLAEPSEAVMRVLELARLDDVFEIRSSA